MPTVTLTEHEWQTLINVLAGSTGAPWTMTNPLLMKLGEQLRAQAASAAKA